MYFFLFQYKAYGLISGNRDIFTDCTLYFTILLVDGALLAKSKAVLLVYVYIGEM